VIIFFIAGLLYLLRFERVDNLGAYRIPPETGLLIPSDFNTYPLQSRMMHPCDRAKTTSWFFLNRNALLPWAGALKSGARWKTFRFNPSFLFFTSLNT
jgi:hypothetical protein